MPQEVATRSGRNERAVRVDPDGQVKEQKDMTKVLTSVGAVRAQRESPAGNDAGGFAAAIMVAIQSDYDAQAVNIKRLHECKRLWIATVICYRPSVRNRGFPCRNGVFPREKHPICVKAASLKNRYITKIAGCGQEMPRLHRVKERSPIP